MSNRSLEDVRSEIAEVSEQLEALDQEIAVCDTVKTMCSNRSRDTMPRLEMRREIGTAQARRNELEPKLKSLQKELTNLV